ncbi:MAG: hypothetical protein DMF05_00280 [Verrucomicrobia bacterium]|nr:MAG: hypothetical protein DMF05_00280 [Verrucomicrobiota bacterium]
MVLGSTGCQPVHLGSLPRCFARCANNFVYTFLASCRKLQASGLRSPELQISLFQNNRILRNLRSIWQRSVDPKKRMAARAIRSAAAKLSAALRAQHREASSRNPSR